MSKLLRLRPVVEIKLYRNDVRCAICKSRMSSEHPNTVRQHNPLTFRMAWMHLRCCIGGFEEIAGMPAKGKTYKDRLEEYEKRFL
jgi:hypothetical protein